MASKAKKRRVWAGAAAALFGLLGIGLAASASAAEPEGGATREPNTDPLDPLPSDDGTRKQIDIAICDCLDQGVSGDEELRKCVVAIVWPDDPWPPVAGDHRSRHDAWDLVAERISAYVAEALKGEGKKWCEEARFVPFPDLDLDLPEPEPEPPGPPTADVGLDLGPEPPDLDPWEDDENYPRPEIFYPVRSGDIFLGTDSSRSIVYRALLSAGYIAAKAHGATDAEATDFAREIADNPARRMRYYELVLCSPWNDALYGTWGYGDKALAGPHGRAIRMLKFHPDNRARILEGLPPMRNIELGSSSWRQESPPRKAKAQWQDAATDFEYLWLPALDLDALWEQKIIEPDPEPWPNGDSRMMPPPSVTVLGFANVPSGVYGCPGLPTEEV